MFTLAITDKHGNIVDEGTFEEGEILVGRSESADVVLPSDNVSRKHARIYTADSRCYVEDMGSSNGVFVNGRRIHEAYQIEASAQIKVGDYYILIQSAGQDDGVHGRLKGRNLSFADETYDIDEKVMLVGRGKDCGLTFVDGSISRAHAKFTVDPSGSVILEDLNSSNGTFVNDEGIQVTTLKGGELIRFGNAEFSFTLPETATNEQPTPAWSQPERKSRKGLWITISILVVLLATGAVLMAVFADDLFGDDEKNKANEDEIAAAKAEREKEREKLEQEKEEEIESLKETARTAEKEERWDAALAEWDKVDELMGGSDQVNNRKTFVKTAKQHKEYLSEAKALLKKENPGKAAEKFRRIIKESSRLSEQTPYTKEAKEGLKTLQTDEIRHQLLALDAIRGNNCKKQDERLKIIDIILAIDRGNQKAKDAKEKAQEQKTKRRCK